MPASSNVLRWSSLAAKVSRVSTPSEPSALTEPQPTDGPREARTPPGSFHGTMRKVTVLGHMLWLEAPPAQPDGRTPWYAEYDARG